MPEQVKHPDHYNWLPGVECIRVVQHFNFNLGNAIKYIWRAGRKDSSSALTDLKKAREYLDFEIARIDGEITSQLVVETPSDEMPTYCPACELRVSFRGVRVGPHIYHTDCWERRIAEERKPELENREVPA